MFLTADSEQFKVEITEILQRTVAVEAEDEYDALDKAEDMCNKSEIILVADDFVDRDIKIITDQRNTGNEQKAISM